jgi:class 3 adenylate cyclase
MRDGLQTANVLFTDVVGSTTTLVRAGAEAADAQRRRHDALVTNVVAVFGGHVVKSTGDGALALLPSADHLVRAGAALQDASRAAGFPIRIGMATGDVVMERGDLFGEPVIVASRLCDVCPAGEVFVDATTVVVRGSRHAPAVTLHDRLMLRGFDAPREVWSVTEGPAPPVRRPSPVEPALGRDADVSMIRDAWAATAASTLIVLCGEPGIGKTHLARAAAEVQDHALWIRFSPSERDGFVTLCTALDDTVSEIAIGVLATLGPDIVSRASVLLPSIAARLPADRAQVPDDPGREATLDALVAVVELIGRERAVVLDDVQWAGPTSSAFVGRLLSSTSGLRLLATSRLPVPGDVAAVATRMLSVGRLPDDAVGEMLRRRGLADRDVTEIARRAGGNPLLALFAAGVTADTGRNSLADAFLSLPRAGLEVLGVAGLLGRTIDIALLGHLTSRSTAELSVLLHDAVGAGLLDGGDTLAFVHDLVREAAESTLPADRRVALHAAAATELQRRGDDLAAVDHVLHGFGALDADQAVESVVAACEELAARLAFEDLLAIAVRLHTAVVADPRCRPRHEAAALLLQSWANELLGDVPRHKEAALAAGRIAQAGGADTLLVEAALSRAGYGLAGLADPDTLELLDAALAVVANDDHARRARLGAMRAFYLLNSEGRGADARAASAAAVARARESADDEALAEVLALRMFVLMASSEVLEQVALTDELRQLTPRLPPVRRRVAWASLHRNSGPLHLQLGDRSGFEDAHAVVHTTAAELNSWLLASITTMWDGLVSLLDGDPDAAERHAESLALARPEERNLVASAAGMLASVHRWRGTSGPVADAATSAILQQGVPLAASIGAVAQALERDDRAGHEVDAVLTRVPLLVDDSTLAAQLASMIEACLLTRRDVPATIAGALAPFAGQLLVTAWGIDVPGAADRFLAILAARDGDTARAAELFERAATLEAQVSSALPLRTQVWRHVLLEDVPMPDVPPALAGLATEAAVLRQAIRP